MRFINTYRQSVEELPDGTNPATTPAVHLGYLPGICAPGREYPHALDGLPRIWRKTCRRARAGNECVAARWQHRPEEAP